jgi:uncharacterized protein DUF4145
MTPFELINTERYRTSPFSVTCPHCGSIASYQKDETKTYPTHASYVAVDIAGSDPDSYQGAMIGQCRCNNRECQEFVHFIGSYVTERDDSDDPPVFLQKFVIKFFFPAVPLIRIPPATPEVVASLLRRSFTVAFTDQSASGNLLRSSIEALLTKHRVARFVTSHGRRHRLTLHQRIARLPSRFRSKTDPLSALKWIGNAASHSELSVEGLRLAFEILQRLLEDLYGTEERELKKAIRRVNRRRKP